MASGSIPQISMIMGSCAGGAVIHTSKSGVADWAFENDIEALLMLRRLFNYMPVGNLEPYPCRPTIDPVERDDQSLDALVPEKPNQPYAIKAAIYKTADDAEFFELQADYATNIVIDLACMDGNVMVFVANHRWCWQGV